MNLAAFVIGSILTIISGVVGCTISIHTHPFTEKIKAVYVGSVVGLVVGIFLSFFTCWVFAETKIFELLNSDNYDYQTYDTISDNIFTSWFSGTGIGICIGCASVIIIARIIDMCHRWVNIFDLSFISRNKDVLLERCDNTIPILEQFISSYEQKLKICNDFNNIYAKMLLADCKPTRDLNFHLLEILLEKHQVLREKCVKMCQIGIIQYSDERMPSIRMALAELSAFRALLLKPSSEQIFDYTEFERQITAYSMGLLFVDIPHNTVMKFIDVQLEKFKFPGSVFNAATLKKDIEDEWNTLKCVKEIKEI